MIGQLALNDDWFARRGPPPAQTDVADADGVVYRYFSGSCFEFHPLANFGVLNADVAAGDSDASTRLATALAARAVPEPGGGLGWEYYFNFSNGRAPWLSGMAQAVAAQAFAGVAAANSSSFDTAGRAYRTIGGRHLLTQVAAGPWIRLYGFSSLVVLNAQLQTVLSLQSYAHTSGNAGGRVRSRPGCRPPPPRCSRASTPATGATTPWQATRLPLSYQEYVTQLLHKLAPADPRFAAAATRFTGYLTQPPAFKLSNAPVGSARFWLSKPAHVDAQSPAGPTRSLSLRPGWHTVTWKLPALSGLYPVHLTRSRLGRQHGVDRRPADRARGWDLRDVGDDRRRPALLPRRRAQPSFVVGAGLDIPTQGTLARQLGLGVVRIGVAWPAGAASPDPGLVQALQRVPAGTGIVVELIAAPLPARRPGPRGACRVRRLARPAGARDSRPGARARGDGCDRHRHTWRRSRPCARRSRRRRRQSQSAPLSTASQTPRASLAALVTAADITGQTVLDVHRLPSRTGGRDGRVDDRRSEDDRDRPRPELHHRAAAPHRRNRLRHCRPGRQGSGVRHAARGGRSHGGRPGELVRRRRSRVRAAIRGSPA